MKSLRLIILSILTFAVTICCRGTATADSTVSISPVGGNDNFAVRYELQEQVKEMEITVEYDGDTLTNPVVNRGQLDAGAGFEVNTESTGVVQVKITSAVPLKKRGTPAMIQFTRKGSEAGKINSLYARLTGNNGEPVFAQIKVDNPPAEQVGQDTKKQDARPLNHRSETGNIRRTIRLESVLDRFRRMSQGSSLASLLSLFGSGGEGHMRQEPPIVLSDGKSTVRLTVKLAEGEDTTLSFVFHGAHCVSLHAGIKGEWIIESIPKKGVYQSSVTVVTNLSATEYPLTVAPSLVTARQEMGETDFARFRASLSRPEHEAGAADRHPGYLDDYIYAANYLALRSGTTGHGFGSSEYR